MSDPYWLTIEQDAVYSSIGQGGGRSGLGARSDGGNGTHRRHGRREDRQDPTDFWSWRRGRCRRHGCHGLSSSSPRTTNAVDVFAHHGAQPGEGMRGDWDREGSE
jgi:hypothetical protein